MPNYFPDYLSETAKRIELGEYKHCRQFVIQHLYPDTLRLLLLLHGHIPIDRVISIGYSGENEVIQKLRDQGVKVLTPDFHSLEETVKAELLLSLESANNDNKKLVIHEVGGYGIKCLHQHFPDKTDRVLGAIEITKQGVWVARQLPALKIPQLNCAETRLKAVEGKLVGEAVVAAQDTIMRKLGLSMTGRRAIVLGYGWVGKGVAETLKAHGAIVSVYDIDPVRVVNASIDGFDVRLFNRDGEIREPVPRIDLVFGASGKCSIGKSLIDNLSDKCFLVSGSSKDVEMDLAYLEQSCTHYEDIHPHVQAVHLKSHRTLFLVNQGYPVNFTGSSVPDEVVEFLFSEFLILVKELLENTPEPGQYPLDPELEKLAAEIWLELR